MYCPKHACGDGEPPCINVHSKVLIVDDEFVTVGSANLANRSLCLDTECNLALEANGDPRIRARDRRPARSPHGRAPRRRPRSRAGARGERRCTQTIEALRDERRRHLEAIDPCVDPAVDAIVPDHEVLDPDGPIDPDVLVADLLPARTSAQAASARGS